MKILHTADVHLGAKFIGLGDKGRIQREQLRASFKSVVSVAIAENVDIVLIAGDLFDSNQQSQSNIDLVVEQFNLLASRGIQVCLIPGTHDCFDSNSIYRKVNFPEKCPNLALFTDQGWNYKEFPVHGLTVYAKPNFSNRSSQSPLDGAGRLSETPYHVAMAHGSLNIPGMFTEDDHVFTTDQIKNSQMHYIALGHWHRQHEYTADRVTAWYAGAPEMISVDQKVPGGVLIITISGSGEVSVETKQTGIRYCDELTIDLSSLDSLTQLKNKLIEGASSNLVRKVVLKGLKNEAMRTSPEELEMESGDKFFHLRIADESHPRISEISEKEYQDRLILAKFIKLMKEYVSTCEGNEQDFAEEALQLGVALLQGKEVL